jgi:hypothetical protein
LYTVLQNLFVWLFFVVVVVVVVVVDVDVILLSIYYLFEKSIIEIYTLYLRSIDFLFIHFSRIANHFHLLIMAN